jgi:hypothetical protein
MCHLTVTTTAIGEAHRSRKLKIANLHEETHTESGKGDRPEEYLDTSQKCAVHCDFEIKMRVVAINQDCWGDVL